MDDLDRALLSELAADARTPVAVLAKRLGAARTTVQARIERLEREGAIAGYTLRLGPAARPRQISATVLVSAEPRAMRTLLDHLHTLTEVRAARTTSGRFDLVLLLEAATPEALDRALDDIGAIPGVTDSESLIHLSTKIDRTA